MDTLVVMLNAWVNALGVPPMVVAFGVGLLLFSLLARRRALSPARSARTSFEPVLDLVRTDLTVDYAGRSIAIPAEALALVDAGNRMAAIKAMREAGGVDLVDARRIVDALTAQRSG